MSIECLVNNIKLRKLCKEYVRLCCPSSNFIEASDNRREEIHVEMARILGISPYHWAFTRFHTLENLGFDRDVIYDDKDRERTGNRIGNKIYEVFMEDLADDPSVTCVNILEEDDE